MTTYSIVPLVSLKQVPILNVKTQQVELRDIRNLFPRGEVINIKDSGEPFDNQIKNKIRENVSDAFELGKGGQGLNDLLDLDESPPRFIESSADVNEWLNPPKLIGKYILTKLDYGTYEVDLREGRPLSQLRSIRVFLSAPPAICYNNCEYYEPTNELKTTYKKKEITASCAFQYFYHNYGNKSNYRKYCGSTKSIINGKKIYDPVVKMKHYSQTNPPQFEDWLSLYKSHNFANGFDRKKIKPLPDTSDVDKRIKDAMSRMKEIEIVDYKPPNYTPEQQYNSMTLIDIVRLCMWMRLNLVAFDDRNQHFISYFDKQFEKTDKLKPRKTKGGIAVRIIDNHAYFVKDSNVTLSAITRQMNYEGVKDSNTAPKKDKSKDELTKNWSDAKWIHHPKVLFRQNIRSIDWGYWMSECDGNIDFDAVKNEEAEALAPSHPLPTPNQLKEIANGDEPTMIWIGKTSLNGVVKLLMNTYKMKPDNMRGLAHTIKRATYGSLMLLGEDQYPDSKIPHHQAKISGNYNYPDIDDEKCMNIWKEKYPELESMAMPSAMKISNAIYNANYEKRDYLSSMNTAVREIFYDGEIKADFRKFQEHSSSNLFSFDVKKAYTNSMYSMDCEWSVFDAIDQPKKFREFKVDAWYLCKETRTGYPYKDVKGLVLYHGCLLRHLLGQGVIPVYIIDSHKKLPKDYFVKFIDECKSAINKDEDGDEYDFVNAKQLVNTFVGELKKRDGICDYKLWMTSDTQLAYKNLLNGLCVTNLDGAGYRNSVYLTSQAQSRYNFVTGQPIRLQIMEKINEINYLVWRSYKTMLWFYNKYSNDNYTAELALVKTDALYISYPPECLKYHTQYIREMDWNKKTSYLDFDPNEYQKLINRFLPDGFTIEVENQIIEGRILDGYHPTSGQLPITFRSNTWTNNLDIKNRWSKSQAKPILQSALTAGGGNFAGRAGTGKTELIKCMDDYTEENRKVYRWVKMIKKLLCGDKYYEECEAWRDNHPCFVEKFAPTNKACNNIGGKTFHKGLGIPFSIAPTEEDEEELEEEESRPVDFMEKIIQRLEGDGKTKPRTDIFVADEISMIGGELWSILCYIKIRIPTIKFLLFGDIKHQLPPVNEEYRHFMSARCIKEITNYNNVNLHYNFRQGDGSEALWDSWSLHPNRFKPNHNDADTELNLCYTNKTRKEVIEYHQDLLDDPRVIECSNPKDYNSKRGQTKELKICVGTPLIARKSNKDLCIAKNEMFIVDDIDNLRLYKKDEPDFKIEIDEKELMINFLSGYCITIHKSQGDTYTEDYTIWDWSKISGGSLLDRKLRYVAQSRSKKPENNISYKL
jgi:hypothetical protein